jgi:hypothetical protein
MKKLVIATMLATVGLMASATEVGVAGIHDIAANKDGVRVTASVGSVAGFTPQLSVSRVDTVYTRYAVGTQYTITKVGPVALAATASGVYQDTIGGTTGYGATAGLKASVALNKGVDLVVGAERFMGQDRISASNGTVTSVGLNVKF